MKIIAPPKVRPCCYGFIDRADTPTTRKGEGSWSAVAQRPFRGSWLWVWGGPDAVLEEIWNGSSQGLVAAMPFSWMRRECEPETFLRHVHVVPSPGLIQLEAAETTPLLQMGLGQPHLSFATVNVGATISFKFHGAVRGVVLVGVEAL